jgi:hypothetical protein
MTRFVRDTLRVLNMRCDEHSALISRAFEQPLSLGERLGLRIHTSYCAGCRHFGMQLRQLRGLASSLRDETDAAPGMPDAVEQRLRRAVSEERPAGHG